MLYTQNQTFDIMVMGFPHFLYHHYVFLQKFIYPVVSGNTNSQQISPFPPVKKNHHIKS